MLTALLTSWICVNAETACVLELGDGSRASATGDVLIRLTGMATKGFRSLGFGGVQMGRGGAASQLQYLIFVVAYL